MLIFTIEVDAPAGLALAIKERLAMDVEKYGDTRVIDVKEGESDGERRKVPGGQEVLASSGII